MYSPRIKEKYIPWLYRDAKNKGKPMTTIVNDIVEEYLVKVRCSNCNTEIELDVPSNVAYCSNCECEVFVRR